MEVWAVTEAKGVDSVSGASILRMVSTEENKGGGSIKRVSGLSNGEANERFEKKSKV